MAGSCICQSTGSQLIWAGQGWSSMQVHLRPRPELAYCHFSLVLLAKPSYMEELKVKGQRNMHFLFNGKNRIHIQRACIQEGFVLRHGTNMQCTTRDRKWKYKAEYIYKAD